jgi:hypothetical protein
MNALRRGLREDRLGILVIGISAVPSFIDLRNFFHPSPSLVVIEIQNAFRRPVEVIRNEGYLLVEQRKGVA